MGLRAPPARALMDHHPLARPGRGAAALTWSGLLIIHVALVLGPTLDGFQRAQASRLLYLHVPLALGGYAAWSGVS